ncbi:MAG: hydrogenase 4 subunit B [Thermoplasmatales archaeon E-plasma]|nr:MAG: hydrogenase 4 subunit B [Thermoplasmatales archaeon E-plasma]
MNIIILPGIIAFLVILSTYSRSIHRICTITGSIILTVVSILYLTGYLAIDSFIIDHFSLSINHLSGAFLLIISTVWFISGINTVIANWTRTRAFFAGLLFFGILGTLFSGNTITLIVFWEAFTISAMFILGLYNRRELLSSYVFLSVGELSTILLILGAAVSFASAGSFSLAALFDNPLAISLWISGFVVKAGIIPLQASEWYSLGMSGIDSSMSILIGVLIPTVSIYAVEEASLSALQFQAIPLTMIMTGAISVFAGAIYASAAENPRVLAAYSTVENVGAMLVLIGVSSLSFATGHLNLGNFATIGVAIYALMHGIGKSTILSSTAFNSDSFNSREWRSMSRSGLVIASVSMMGLAPLGGGIGEWMLLESLFISSLTMIQYYAIIAVLAGALSALGAGISVVVFTKFVGFTGTASPKMKLSPESRKNYGIGYLLIALPLMTPLLFMLFSGISGYGSKVNFLTGGEIFPNGYTIFSPYNGNTFGVLTPTFTIISLAVIFSCIYLFRPKHVREVDPWAGGVERGRTYNSFNYSNPARITFVRLFPRIEGFMHKDYSSHRFDMVYLTFLSLFRKYERISRVIALKIMNGNVRQYVMYIMITLILSIAIALFI